MILGLPFSALALPDLNLFRQLGVQDNQPTGATAQMDRLLDLWALFVFVTFPPGFVPTIADYDSGGDGSGNVFHAQAIVSQQDDANPDPFTGIPIYSDFGFGLQKTFRIRTFEGSTGQIVSAQATAFFAEAVPDQPSPPYPPLTPTKRIPISWIVDAAGDGALFTSTIGYAEIPDLIVPPALAQPAAAVAMTAERAAARAALPKVPANWREIAEKLAAGDTKAAIARVLAERAAPPP